MQLKVSVVVSKLQSQWDIINTSAGVRKQVGCVVAEQLHWSDETAPRATRGSHTSSFYGFQNTPGRDQHVTETWQTGFKTRRERNESAFREREREMDR